jgi:hypothetical protein
MKIDKFIAWYDALSAIRDALLPKLLLGEIRVKEAEGFLEKA